MNSARLPPLQEKQNFQGSEFCGGAVAIAAGNCQLRPDCPKTAGRRAAGPWSWSAACQRPLLWFLG